MAKGLGRHRWLGRIGVDNIIMTLIMLLFGAALGMSEETIAFVVLMNG